MSGREELQSQPSTDKRREEIARIILGPKSQWNTSFGADDLDEWSFYPAVVRALAKADAIMALFVNPAQSPEPVQNLHEFDGEWRDIASAPKDGVPFWAYQPGREQFVCWEQDTRDGVVWMDEIDSEPKPTHWRPLPAPPSIPETKGTGK